MSARKCFIVILQSFTRHSVSWVTPAASFFIYGSPRWFGALFFDLRFVSRRSPILLAPTIAREGFVFRFKGFLGISNSSPFSGRAHEVSSSVGKSGRTCYVSARSVVQVHPDFQQPVRVVFENFNSFTLVALQRRGICARCQRLAPALQKLFSKIAIIMMFLVMQDCGVRLPSCAQESIHTIFLFYTILYLFKSAKIWALCFSFHYILVYIV